MWETGVEYGEGKPQFTNDIQVMLHYIILYIPTDQNKSSLLEKSSIKATKTQAFSMPRDHSATVYASKQKLLSKS